MRGRRRCGSVDVVEDAFVLCEGGRISAVGRMRDLDPLDGDVEELDGRGCAAIPGLVDCHTHACFAGDRVEEFALRSAGPPTRSSTRPAAGSCRRSARPVPPGEEGLATRSPCTAAGCSPRGTTTFEAKSGLRPRPRHGARHAACRPRCRRLPTWLGAHAVPPEFADADAYLDFALAEVLPEAARSPRRQTSSSSGARSTPLRPGATWRRAERPASRCACTRTSSPRRGRPARDRARARERRPPRGDRAGRACEPGRSDVAAVLLPVARALPRPPDAARRGR